jgi:hypothetical protein
MTSSYSTWLEAAVCSLHPRSMIPLLGTIPAMLGKLHTASPPKHCAEALMTNLRRFQMWF